MTKLRILLFIIFFINGLKAISQESLPNITVKNLNGKIIVSWLNDFDKPVTNIIVQRSYDSLKNFTSIGTVLNPANKENGYPDNNPPYLKMYYRLSISFEGGTYVVGPSVRPVKEIPEPVLSTNDSSYQPIPDDKTRFSWQQDKIFDSITVKKPNEISYPSSRIFSGRQQQVIIHLPDAGFKKYRVRFFDENDQFLFELNKLTDEYLILEKVNFVHSGWFHFEIYENEKMIEKNKFFVAKDAKKNNR